MWHEIIFVLQKDAGCSPEEDCSFILDIGNNLDLSHKPRVQIKQEEQAAIDLLFVMSRYYEFLARLLNLFAVFDRISRGVGYLLCCQK